VAYAVHGLVIDVPLVMCCQRSDDAGEYYCQWDACTTSTVLAVLSSLKTELLGTVLVSACFTAL
jgi:hypothetical protein